VAVLHLEVQLVELGAEVDKNTQLPLVRASDAHLAPTVARYVRIRKVRRRLGGGRSSGRFAVNAYLDALKSDRSVRKLPRQVDSPELETSWLNTLGLKTAGGTLPRESWGRHSL
jgi:hypothetical protein